MAGGADRVAAAGADGVGVDGVCSMYAETAAAVAVAHRAVMVRGFMWSPA